MTGAAPMPPGTGPQQPRFGSSAGRTPLGIEWGWWAALGILVIALVIGAALVFNYSSQPAAATTLSAAELVDNPDAYHGDRVVVTGRIDELLTDRALAMGSDLASGDFLVLVEPSASVGGYGFGGSMVAPLQPGQTYDAGDVAQFSGTVREFDRDQLSDELGLVLNDDLFDTWDGKPALVVDRFDIATVGRMNAATTTTSG